MEDDDPVVGSQANVAFDAGADIERGRERLQTIFRCAEALVQAAVSVTGPTRIERIRL